MATPSEAAAPLGFRYQYAPKFICTANIPGTSQTTSSFLPGSYQTAVNIHNPHEKAVKLRLKIALTGGIITRWIMETLKGDQVIKIDCADARPKFDLQVIHGFEGFLVIESSGSIDVTAVYTAGKDAVASIDVKQIHERKLG
jgi:hypothetical protein